MCNVPCGNKKDDQMKNAYRFGVGRIEPLHDLLDFEELLEENIL